MNEDIMVKIRKLLALTESSNENEAKSAMLQVQRLMVKHKLTMKEIEESKQEPINVVENVTDITYTRARWKMQLGHVIADNFGCYAYARVQRNKTIVFFGKDEDTLVCKIMLEYALKCVEDEVRKYKNQYKREGKSTRGIENLYAIGFIQGLKTSFDKQKKDNEQEWGLILVKDPEVVEAYDNIEFRKPTALKPMELAEDSEVYHKAIKDGENFSVSDKIANEGNDSILAIG